MGIVTCKRSLCLIETKLFWCTDNELIFKVKHIATTTSFFVCASRKNAVFLLHLCRDHHITQIPSQSRSKRDTFPFLPSIHSRILRTTNGLTSQMSISVFNFKPRPAHAHTEFPGSIDRSF